jgi:hypothetical protein
MRRFGVRFLVQAQNPGNISSMARDLGNAAAYMRAYVKRRSRERRAEALAMLGDSCKTCGTVEALEFDHVDPATKLFDIGTQSWHVSRSRFLEEVAKCQILCRKCHLKKTGRYLEVEHGGGVSGKKNCPCQSCKKRKQEYMRNRYQKIRLSSSAGRAHP